MIAESLIGSARSLNDLELVRDTILIRTPASISRSSKLNARQPPVDAGPAHPKFRDFSLTVRTVCRSNAAGRRSDSHF
jgi:hypothetical protein